MLTTTGATLPISVPVALSVDVDDIAATPPLSNAPCTLNVSVLLNAALELYVTDAFTLIDSAVDIDTPSTSTSAAVTLIVLDVAIDTLPTHTTLPDAPNDSLVLNAALAPYTTDAFALNVLDVLSDAWPLNTTTPATESDSAVDNDTAPESTTTAVCTPPYGAPPYGALLTFPWVG
jgi:hypothetical protein